MSELEKPKVEVGQRWRTPERYMFGQQEVVVEDGWIGQSGPAFSFRRENGTMDSAPGSWFRFATFLGWAPGYGPQPPTETLGSPSAPSVKRYVAEKFEIPLEVEGIPILVRMRLMLDREKARIRAVRSVYVYAGDGSKLPEVHDGYIDDIETASNIPAMLTGDISLTTEPPAKVTPMAACDTERAERLERYLNWQWHKTQSEMMKKELEKLAAQQAAQSWPQQQANQFYGLGIGDMLETPQGQELGKVTGVEPLHGLKPGMRFRIAQWDEDIELDSYRNDMQCWVTTKGRRFTADFLLSQKCAPIPSPDFAEWQARTAAQTFLDAFAHHAAPIPSPPPTGPEMLKIRPDPPIPMEPHLAEAAKRLLATLVSARSRR